MDTQPSGTAAGLHYDLHLVTDPETQYLDVRGSIAYHAPTAHLERVRFYLHHQFEITRLHGKRVEGYQFMPAGETGLPFLPQAGVLDVYFDPPLRAGETALIEFTYAGAITEWPIESASVVRPDWVELSLYLPWYPYQYSDEPASLTFTLKVTCPPAYQVASFGRPARPGDDWFFEWPYPTSDIVVAVGKDIAEHAFASPPNQVHLHTTTFQDDSAARLGEDLIWTLERFAGWFGPTRPSDFTLIESPRLLGGGYARRGMVVLAGLEERDYLDQREAYLRYLAHETAHAWWWEAPTHSWDDWLNESFAEFSALLAVRERFGDATYNRFLDRKRERDPDELPLWGFDRANVAGPEQQSLVERMLYDKGPLLLSDLAERIGYSRFLELCRAMLWSGVRSSEHFLALLEELENAETSRWMEGRLKNT
jgi:hypothetical protein